MHVITVGSFLTHNLAKIPRADEDDKSVGLSQRAWKRGGVKKKKILHPPTLTYSSWIRFQKEGLKIYDCSSYVHSSLGGGQQYIR